MPLIRVLVADDSQLIRETLSGILSQYSEFVVVAEASTGWEAIEKAKQVQPDVVLLDISMPELNGLQAAPLIKNAAPNAAILIATRHNHPFFVREAFAVGAHGFLNKADAGTDLRQALNDVFLRKPFVSRSLQMPLVDSSTPPIIAPNPEKEK